jgi:GH15 family glucan-1,4-alpha-glucosidase
VLPFAVGQRRRALRRSQPHAAISATSYDTHSTHGVHLSSCAPTGAQRGSALSTHWLRRLRSNWHASGTARAVTARIEDYALIGDCETAALVSRTGSIDWLCWPRFDSPACFAALIGVPDNGYWRIAPRAPDARIARRYREGTLILDTTFETSTGAVTLVDFIPIRGESSDLVRIVYGRRGRVELCSELVLRFDYGCVVPWVTRLDRGTLRAIAGPDMVVLAASVPLHGRGLATLGDFAVAAGEVQHFVLCHAPSHRPQPEPVEPHQALADTEQFWRSWIAQCNYRGEWPEPVARSLITLKALTYAPTGGLVAAPTTSLPERIGGKRNWDYRFCWLRDATLTLLALMDAGYRSEAQAWRDWLLRAVAGTPARIQIMYGLGGERRLPEWELDWLSGYEGSLPVRAGNAAAKQIQLDVYGELMDALHQARHEGIAPSSVGWALQQALIDHLATIWSQPDEGIWEVRGGPRHFTHSKVMAWVASIARCAAPKSSDSLARANAGESFAPAFTRRCASERTIRRSAPS